MFGFLDYCVTEKFDAAELTSYFFPPTANDDSISTKVDTAVNLYLSAYDDDGDELRRIREMAGIQEERKGKPDFLDMDKDGDKEEPMKKAIKDKEEDQVDESVERGLWSLWQRIQ